MLITANAMRTILLLCGVSMSLLAVLFLRNRKMSAKAYLGWGILAVLLPIAGPFLVIFTKPGRP